jgi:hypothetical protein
VNFRKYVIAACIFAFAVTAPAQSTFGNIVGTVQDQSHASGPLATITIRNLDDNSIHTAVSSDNGSFEALNLKAGRYSVSIVKEGFTDYSAALVQLDARQTARLDATLSLAAWMNSSRIIFSPTLARSDTAPRSLGSIHVWLPNSVVSRFCLPSCRNATGNSFMRQCFGVGSRSRASTRPVFLIVAGHVSPEFRVER